MTVDRYREVCAQHRWNVPPEFNIADAVCGRHADDGARLAIYWEDESGATATLTFWDLQQQANRCPTRSRRLASGAATASRSSCRNGPKPPSPTSPAIRWAPSRCRLSFLFGPEALEYRLHNAEARLRSSIRRRFPISRRSATTCPACAMRSASPARANRGCSTGSRCCKGLGRFLAGDDASHRPGATRLHQRHHRPAERRADAAPMPARQPARLRLFARRVSAGRTTCSGRRRTGRGLAA